MPSVTRSCVKLGPRSFRRGMLARDISLAHGSGEAMLAEAACGFAATIRPGMTWPFRSTTWQLALIRKPARVS